MSRFGDDELLVGVGVGLVAGLATELVVEHAPGIWDRGGEPRESLATTCCGAVFAADVGPADIVPLKGEAVSERLLTISDATRMSAADAARHFPAYRDGECPICSAPRPALERV